MITKYAGVSCYGVFLVAFALTYLPVDGWVAIVLKTMVLLFLLHLTLYSFCVAFSAKHIFNKVLLVLFSIVFPAMSGIMLYLFRGLRKADAEPKSSQ